LVLDDTLIEKPHSSQEHSDLVKWYWSDGQKKGINLVKLLWVCGDLIVPIDYRIVVPGDGKTKNEFFREMLRTAKHRGFAGVTALFDSWYSANENLKLIEKLGYKCVTRFKSNRRVIANEVSIRITALAGKTPAELYYPDVAS